MEFAAEVDASGTRQLLLMVELENEVVASGSQTYVTVRATMAAAVAEVVRL